MIVESYEFSEPLRSDNYVELLSQLELFSDTACFVVSEGISRYGPRTAELIDLMASDLLEIESDIDAWPGTICLPGGGSDRYLYTLNAHVLAVLAGAASSVFDWHHRALPDDLHFLRADKTVVFASIGHEEQAWVELTPDELRRWGALGKFALEPSQFSE